MKAFSISIDPDLRKAAKELGLEKEESGFSGLLRDLLEEAIIGEIQARLTGLDAQEYLRQTLDEYQGAPPPVRLARALAYIALLKREEKNRRSDQVQE